MEIERKFLIKRLPESLDLYEHKKIAQGYLNVNPVVRVRKSDDEYYLTYKGSGLMVREEYNLPLTKEAYDNLVKKIDEKFDKFGQKLDDITTRLDKNDVDTAALKEALTNSEKTRSADSDETDGKLDNILLAMGKLKWYWPAALVAIFGIIAYHPQLLDFIRNLF